jgi:hypothetical protein
MRFVIPRAVSRALSLMLMVSAVPLPERTAQAQRPVPGTAKVALTGDGVSVSGEYPTTLCGGPYLLGKGMSYQTRAGEWQITVASETRSSGTVALNQANGRINVVVKVNGPKQKLVRGPRDAGTFEVSGDFNKAEATLDLRNMIGKDSAKLVVTFTCAGDK